MAPFKSVWGLINVWSIRTASTDSGISIPGCPQSTHPDCVTPCHKRTYYQVEGCFGDTPYPGYVGIAKRNQIRIREAAASAVPIEYVHLILVIANYDKYGGSAFPKQGLAFATMGDGTDLDEWVQLAAHECAHVIGDLAEERIVCVPKNPVARYPNQARAEDVDNNAVWWKTLAKARELQNGEFKAIHRYTDPLDTYTGQPDMTPSKLYSMLGAFWGCQNFDADQATDVGCNKYSDTRGRNFFRPMAECRMRKLRFDFCRACGATLASRIKETCA
jgi:hypothetical protein